METPVAATLPVDRRWRAVSFLEANGLVVAAVAVVALLALVLVRAELIGDTWMMLVSGREVAQHGLPQDLRITDLGAHDEAARNL